jgi:hypothetical protein
MTQQRLVAGAFLSLPFLLQIPFTVLTVLFDYPDILRRPAAVVLRQYLEAGPSLPVVWYGYGALALALSAAIAALPELLLTRRPGLLRWASRVGVASGLTAVAGIWRWVFAVPVLARQFASAPTPEAAGAVALMFEVQHQLLGAMIGEHLGQLLLGGWTAGVALAAEAEGPWFRRTGLAAGALLAAGSFDALAGTFPAVAALHAVPVAGFVLWAAWCVWLGGRLWKQAQSALR